MTEDKKVTPDPGMWAIITLHPWLPGRAEQAARARAWGVEESRVAGYDLSRLIVDDVRKVRTTNWPGRLPERAAFLETMRALGWTEQRVFFANPLCVGFSEAHARHTVEAVFAAGLSLYVHTVKDNGAAVYCDGDDMAEFFDAVGLMANAAHQRAHRARKS